MPVRAILVVVPLESERDARGLSRDVLQVRVPRSPFAVEGPEDQGALGAMLDPVGEWAKVRLPGLEHPGLQLDIGLPSEVDLLRGHNLHSYAAAFASRIKAATGTQFSAVEVRKRHADSSALTLFSAPAVEQSTTSESVLITTRQSYAGPGFMKVVGDATASIRDVASSGAPLRMKIAYTTGFPRTWAKLLRPTVQGIFQLRSTAPLAESGSARVVEISLTHVSLGSALDHRVKMAISVARLPA